MMLNLSPRADVCVTSATAPPGKSERGHGWYSVYKLDPVTGGIRGAIGWLARVTPATVGAATWWKVADAGPGIPADETLRYPGLDEALTALLDIRAAHADWFTPGADGLTEFDRQILQAERFIPEMRCPRGGRLRAIKELFNVSPPLYAHHLITLITGPRKAAALAYDYALADAAGVGTGVIYALEERIARRRCRRDRQAATVRALRAEIGEVLITDVDEVAVDAASLT